MKKTIYSMLLLLGAASSLTSCSDWLDVSPKTEVREGDLFGSPVKVCGLGIDLH